MPEGSISVLLLLVFSFGSHAAANMAFGLVFLQNGFDLLIKLMVCQPKPIGNILMYGRLGNAEALSGLAYGGIVFHDVSGQLGTPFLG